MLHARTVLAATAALALAACASAPPAEPRSITLDGGTRVPAANTTSYTRSIPATALLTSGPYDIRAKLKAYGLTSTGALTYVVVDGNRHVGTDILDSILIEDIQSIDLVRNVWGGLNTSGAVLTITTKRKQ